MDIRKLVKKQVSALKAYDAKEIPCRIKLDANESPYGFADAAGTYCRDQDQQVPGP